MGIWEWLLLLLLLLFGGTRQNVSEPVIIENEGETSIESITEYGEQFFTEEDGWYVFQTNENDFGSLSVSWTDSESEIVIYIIDYPTPIYNPNRIFDVSWVNATLEPNYDEVELDQQCENDGIYLFEFDIEYQDEPYRALTWIFYLDDIYIRNIVFIFPAEREDELDEYGEQMLPDLYTCED
jgi:hypothetical protein